MSLPEVVVGLMFVGVTLYAVFGGADFGAGFWDLVAGGAERGAAQRRLIEHTIGPVWEANHVWLIFVLVVLWTGFPDAFAPIMATLYVPLTAAAVGIILRGAGFAFRKAVTTIPLQRIFGAAFATSSLLTPFFLGTIAGAVASGRVPAGIGDGDPVSSWVNPTSILGGVLAVAVCAYLASVFLATDADRRGDQALAEGFRRRGIGAAAASGVVALAGIAVLAADAPVLYDGLTGRGLPLIALSVAGGLGSLASLVTRRFRWGRVAAAVAVVAVIWGWGAAQYPFLLVDELTIDAAAGSRSTMIAMVASLLVGGALFTPALVALLLLTARGELAPSDQA